MKKTNWNTYLVRGFAYVVTQDQRSAGGVHRIQVRKTKAGWQKRIVQSNGCHTSFCDVTAISDAEGESAFETAKNSMT